MPWRRRRSARRFQRPVQRRKPVWINKAISIPLEAQQWVSATELVGWRDYTDPDAVGRQETAVVLRSIGRIWTDMVIVAPGANACVWASALVVFSEEALENVITADPGDMFLHDYATRTTNMQRLDMLQVSPIMGYVGAFRFIRTGEGPADCTDFFSEINLPNECMWNWDVKVKRRLKTDECLFLISSGAVICFDEDIAAFNEIDARTLIYDD